MQTSFDVTDPSGATALVRHGIYDVVGPMPEDSRLENGAKYRLLHAYGEVLHVAM
jgi:hypothetical protein